MTRISIAEELESAADRIAVSRPASSGGGAGVRLRSLRLIRIEGRAPRFAKLPMKRRTAYNFASRHRLPVRPGGQNPSPPPLAAGPPRKSQRPFTFGMISSTRTLSPISLAQASALALSSVVNTVRQCGASNTLTT